MPRIIFKCPYLKGGSPTVTAHLKNLVGYIATRDGAEKIDPGNTQLAATNKQKELVDQLVQSFPESMELFEYEDYLSAPNRGNASAFITMAIEQNLSQLIRREKYLEYIAKRPRAQRFGAHGLFTGDKDSLVLSQTAKAIAEYPGNVWLPIISLRREDAARLGYDNAENWKSFLSSYAMQMATAMKIPWEQFRWYAAFHNESHHPHIHMVCYSADPAKGFLTKTGIAQIKSGLAKHIFRQELTELYQKQTKSRNALNEDARSVLEQLIEQMRSGTAVNHRMEKLMEHLAERLRHTGGKKQYGYLKAPLKAVVDEIVDELAKDPCVAAAYALWHELREDVLRTYRDDLPPRLPLSQQKEFKRIKNIVIEEAVKIGAHQQVFHPDDQQDGVSAATPGDPSLPELTQPDDDCGDPVESPPEAPPEKSGSAKAHMEWSKEYRLARRCLFGDKNQPQDFEQAFSLFQEGAQKGNALAMCDLGQMLADGLGQEIDIQAAHVWYRKALAAFHAVEEQKKNRYAEYRIGKLYAAGLGCEQDYGEAARWFQLSVDKEYKYAQYSLAGLFRRRQGVEQDDVRALELYTASAHQDFPYAAYELGKMYQDGIGCEKDTEVSEQWYQQAFAGFLELEQQSHDDKLQYRIGWMLLHGVGTGKDEAATRGWFERASKLGNPHAQYQLAKMILDAPSSTPEQTAQALEWLTKAAETGQDCAQYALGKIYRDGQGIEKDIQKAVNLFTLAAEQGNSFAAFTLGKLYLSGDAGLPIDPPFALKWLTFSAKLGNQFAQYRLGKLLLQGEEVPKDTETAIRWLTAVAEQGNQYAQYALGKLYLLGKEVPKDKSNATKWFQLAADQGSEYAQYFLEHMDDWLGQPPAAAVISLLHHLANIFQEQSQPPSDGIRVAVDRKLLRKIKAKKIAQGHKADDHEPEMKL